MWLWLEEGQSEDWWNLTLQVRLETGQPVTVIKERFKDKRGMLLMAEVYEKQTKKQDSYQTPR